MVVECFLKYAIVDQTESDANSVRMPLFNPPDLCLPVPELLWDSTAEQREGIALHALMERLTNQVPQWPIQIPGVETIASWLPCSSAIAKIIQQQAINILGNAVLEPYFNPTRFTYARNEMDISYQQQMLRLDRLVVLENEVWILDYKRQLLENEQIHYQEQMNGYREALTSIFFDKKIRAALILADGQLIEML